jgi:hypothetical protein
MKRRLEPQRPAPRANAEDLANLKVERGEIPRLPVAKEAGVGARHVRPKKLQDAHRTPAPIDFAEVNRAALAALPAVLARLLPDGKRVGAELVALIRAAAIAIAARSRSTVTTAVGRTSRLVTRAAIQFRWSHISPTSRKPRRRGC